jgi:hypothetical protein
MIAGGLDLTSKQPWWARVSTIFVAPTLISAYLVYQVVGTLQLSQNTIVANQTTIITNQSAMIQMLNAQATAYSQNSMQLEEIELVLTQICANGARSSAERTACFRR